MMRPLEPSELFVRCDLAGEARVLTVGPNPVGPGMFARLEFTRIVKGRIKSFRTELPGIAIVESGQRRPVAKERRLTRYRHETLNIQVVRLRRTLRGPSPPILGSGGPFCCEVGTFVFAHLTWAADKGVYVSSWWNAVSTLQEPADQHAS